MKKQNAVVHYLQKTFYLKHRKLERKGMWIILTMLLSDKIDFKQNTLLEIMYIFIRKTKSF